MSLLGDLYAFGLLGAFTVTCLALDIVRWHERSPATHPHAAQEGGEGPMGPGGGPHAVGRLTFLVGVVTTVLVTLAWTTNLIAKPPATLFGGVVTLVGLAIAAATYVTNQRRGHTAVFPLLHRPGTPVMFLSRGRRMPPATVLAVLPQEAAQIEVVLRASDRAAAGGPVVLLQRGRFDPPARSPRLLEITNPYLRDADAQAAFSHAAARARRHGSRYQYLYVPSTAGPEEVVKLWQTLRPRDTLAAGDDVDVLAGLPSGNLRRRSDDGIVVFHYQPTSERP